MTATCIYLDDKGTRATMVMRPSWLARLFGAKVVTAELVAHEYDTDSNGARRWRFAASMAPVRDSKHGDEIIRAIDFRPLTPLPSASVWPRGSRP